MPADAVCTESAAPTHDDKVGAGCAVESAAKQAKGSALKSFKSSSRKPPKQPKQSKKASKQSANKGPNGKTTDGTKTRAADEAIRRPANELKLFQNSRLLNQRDPLEQLHEHLSELINDSGDEKNRIQSNDKCRKANVNQRIAADADAIGSAKQSLQRIAEVDRNNDDNNNNNINSSDNNHNHNNDQPINLNDNCHNRTSLSVPAVSSQNNAGGNSNDAHEDTQRQQKVSRSHENSNSNNHNHAQAAVRMHENEPTDVESIVHAGNQQQHQVLNGNNIRSAATAASAATATVAANLYKSNDDNHEDGNIFTVKKGILWQQQIFDKFHLRLFSRWKKRYFILTTDYLVCFKRSTSKVGHSEMGQFLYKVSLCSD